MKYHVHFFQTMSVLHILFYIFCKPDDKLIAIAEKIVENALEHGKNQLFEFHLAQCRGFLCPYFLCFGAIFEFIFIIKSVKITSINGRNNEQAGCIYFESIENYMTSNEIHNKYPFELNER